MELLLFTWLQFARATDVSSAPNCKALGQEVDGWWDAAETTETRKVPSDKQARAFEVLSRTVRSEVKPATDWRARLKANFAVEYAHWLKANSGDCPQVRLWVSKGLINSIGQDPSAKAKITTAIAAILREQKTPSILNNMIDILIAEYASGHELWAAKDTLSADLARVHAEMKAEHTSWNKKYEHLFDFKNSGKVSADANTRELQKKAVLEEIDLSEAYAKRLREALAKGQIDVSHFG